MRLVPRRPTRLAHQNLLGTPSTSARRLVSLGRINVKGRLLSMIIRSAAQGGAKSERGCRVRPYG
jgi:hypothetical protein